MNPEERKEQVLKIIEEKKFVTVSFLASRLFASEPTIRRDLSALEKEGAIKRTAGGALAIKEYYQEPPFTYKAKTNIEQKKYIADLAIDFISSSQTIFMDASSTCTYLARKMTSLANIKVLCTGLSTCELLSENEEIQVYCPGGTILPQKKTIVGPSSIEYISRHTADIAFVSCRGLDASFGVSDFIEHEAAIKRVFRSHAAQVILLIDSSKFNKKFFFQSLPLAKIDVVISDARPPAAVMDALEHFDIEVVY